MADTQHDAWRQTAIDALVDFYQQLEPEQISPRVLELEYLHDQRPMTEEEVVEYVAICEVLFKHAHRQFLRPCDVLVWTRVF